MAGLCGHVGVLMRTLVGVLSATCPCPSFRVVSVCAGVAGFSGVRTAHAVCSGVCARRTVAVCAYNVNYGGLQPVLVFWGLQ